MRRTAALTVAACLALTLGACASDMSMSKEEQMKKDEMMKKEEMMKKDQMKK